jgi:lysozyme
MAMAKAKRRTKQNTKITEKERRVFLFWSILCPFLLALLFAIWHYRDGIKYYVKSVIESPELIPDEQNKHDARNVFLMSRHEDYVFGIDVSHYQGQINWDSVTLIHEKFPIDFVFVRATLGSNDKDKKFIRNWKELNRRSKIKGAYHYFRPNENSLKQANNFIKTVKLQPGDLPPVLDIEERPRSQSMDSLKVGLKRWLDRVEQHYKIRPIVYSGDSYFTDFLEREFDDYLLWIANYNFWVEKPKKHWNFWQFSERGAVNGILGPVDLNMYRGNIESLESHTIPFVP